MNKFYKDQFDEILMGIYNKLDQNNLLNTWKMFSKSIIRYLKLEWGKENPPAFYEISDVTCSFIANVKNSQNANLKKIFNILSANELEILNIAMISMINIIINPKNKEY